MFSLQCFELPPKRILHNFKNFLSGSCFHKLAVLAELPECSVFTELVAMQDQGKQEMIKNVEILKDFVCTMEVGLPFHAANHVLHVKSVDFLLIFLLKKKKKRHTLPHYTGFKSLPA